MNAHYDYFYQQLPTDSIDIDDLVKKLDQKIAELEAEEAAEKEIEKLLKLKIWHTLCQQQESFQKRKNFYHEQLECFA